MIRPPSSTKPPHHESAQTPQGVPRRTSVRERARLGGVERPKRSPQAAAVSVLAHIVVAVVVAQLLTFGHGLSGFLDFGKESKKIDRVTYVATTPPPVKAPPTPQVRPATRPPTTVSAPAAVSGGNVDVPTPPPVVSRADTGSGGDASGTGNGIGAIDPNLKGVTPAYADKRVWQGPAGNGVAPARDGTERLDSIIGFAITAARDSLDSLARAQGKYGRAPGDWTTKDKNGNKWGWDNMGIRLGKVVIPNALLSLLPMNAQVGLSGNYTAMERERRLSLSRADIMRMSDRTLGDADFKMLATELRDRRERERRDRLRAPSASVAPTAPAPQPPKD